MLACLIIVICELYLNSEFYPYDDLNSDFGKKRYVNLFDTRVFVKSITESTAKRDIILFIKKKLFVVIARDKTNPSRAPL